MKKLGFSTTFINFIKILYKNNTSVIINNGFLSSQINMVILPLYVVQGEVTTANINNNASIKGINIPNKTKQIKISQ